MGSVTVGQTDLSKRHRILPATAPAGEGVRQQAASMKIVVTSVILLAGFFSSAEASDVTVLFVHPEAYADAAENGEYGLV